MRPKWCQWKGKIVIKCMLFSCQILKLFKIPKTFFSVILKKHCTQLSVTSHMGTSSWNFRPPAAPLPPTPHTPLAQEKPLTLPFHLPRSSPYLSSSVCPGGKHWPFVCMSGGWGVGCVALLFLCPLQYLSVWEAGEWQVWAWPHVSL